MSWFFNADYETFLYSGRDKYDFNSSKINQEFEYLIAYLEDDPIFTSKEYDDVFKKHFFNLTGKRFKTESDKKNAKAWCCPVEDISLSKKLHSKIVSTKLALEFGLEEETSIVDESIFNPKDNYLYRMEGELSGRGNLIWPKDSVKIQKLLDSGCELIEQPLRNRVMDFSTLVLEDRSQLTYENLVDDKFQYKGSIISQIQISDEYEAIIQKVTKSYFDLGIKTPFSVDSYKYEKDGELIICPVSEVNARKTMGYIAWKLAALFGIDKGAFLILPNRAANFEEFKRSIWLSPAGNQFQCLLLEARDRVQLENISNSFNRVS